MNAGNQVFPLSGDDALKKSHLFQFAHDDTGLEEVAETLNEFPPVVSVLISG